MDTRKTIPSREDRKQQRYEVDGEVILKVLFTKSQDVVEVRGRLKNAGPGGIYVETDQEIPPGMLADLDLKLDGRPLANTLGLVRWMKPGDGVGIEFFYATDEEREALEGYLADWIKSKRRAN